ncbi:WD40 repeat domain-containing serine/threonine protein kinase [Streptosporangium sp. OZ121]|uniref:WD40 repeat domain-containing serine/threonine protein kinase n=1 Tax=Streptosporangium sp. OZ121 TaxID=3444183 RepID=UPI003F7A55EB
MATPLLPGDPRQLGAYWLARRLGVGGQGVVYEGYDRAGGRVAVKALHGAVVTGDHRDQLRREVEALGRVAPYCTARIIEVDLDHAPPYLVSEYVPGPDLHSEVREHGPYGSGELLRLAIGIATALCSIHRAGVTHRDLKPANVLLGPDGPRVIDFGIARTQDMSSSTTGLLKGTLSWMAPELFQGQGPSPAVDVWAWGAIVLFAATGTPPFAGEWPRVAHRVLTHHPDTSVLDEPLCHLVERALSKIPADRPEAEDILLGLVGVADPAAAEKKAAAEQATTTTAPSQGEPAEEVFTRLGTSAQEAVPRILLRLVAPGEHAEDCLRSARRTDFADGQTSEQDIEHVLRVFTEAEILAWQDGLVTLSSAALIRAWPRLGEWVEAEREGLGIHQTLAGASRLWDDHGRKSSDLFQGTALGRAQSWAASSRRLPLNHTEQAFLDACTALGRRRGRLRSLLSATLAILLVLAGTTAAIAVVQSRSLQDRNLTIFRQLKQAVGTRVAGLATGLRRSDPLTAKRLALAAATLVPGSYEARHALLTLYSQPELYTYQPPGIDGSWRRGGDATGRLRVFAKGNEVRIADIDARAVVRSFAFPGEPLDMRAFSDPMLSGDGKVVALLRRDRTITLFDTASGRPRPVTFRAPTVFFGLDHTGSRLLLSEPASTSLWDTATGRRLVRIPHLLSSAEFTPDGRHLIVPRETSLNFWDLRTGREARTVRLTTGPERISRIVLSPDGRFLALVHGKRLGVVRYDRLDPEQVRWRTIPAPAQNEGIVFSATSRYVAFNGAAWDTADMGPWKHTDPGTLDDDPVFTYVNDNCYHYAFGPGDRTLRCIDSQNVTTVISFGPLLPSRSLSRDGHRPYTRLSTDGSTLALGYLGQWEIWDPIRAARRSVLPANDYYSEYELSVDGRLLGLGKRNGDIEIWDTTTATRKATLATGRSLSDASASFGFSPDGRTLAVLAESEKKASLLELWDIASATRRAASPGRPSAGTYEVWGVETWEVPILFSRDSRTVISADDQGVVEVSTGRRLVSPDSGVSDLLAMSPNGLLADNTYQGTMVLRDGRTLQPVARTTIGGDLAAFSPDGRLLVVLDATNRIRLWDVTANRPIGLPLAGLPPRKSSLGGTLKSLAFTSDGTAVLAVDGQTHLRTHLIAPAEVKRELCAQVSPLTPADWAAHIPEVPYRKTC